MAFDTNLIRRLAGDNLFLVLFHIAFIVLMGIYGRYSVTQTNGESPYIYSSKFTILP